MSARSYKGDWLLPQLTPGQTSEGRWALDLSIGTGLHSSKASLMDGWMDDG